MKFTNLYAQHSAIEKSMNAATDPAVRHADFVALLEVERAIEAERERRRRNREAAERRRERRMNSVTVRPITVRLVCTNN